MFKVKVKQAAQARRVKTYYQLAARLSNCTEEISVRGCRMMARRLWLNEGIPTLATLDLVCEALGCELCELVVRIPAKKKKAR